MNDLLKSLTDDDKSLLAAFNSLRETPTSPLKNEQFIEYYTSHFHSVEPTLNTQSAHFQRFSLVDPNIRTVLTSNTETVR